MSNYVYQNWLPNNDKGVHHLISLGAQGEIEWLYEASINQLIVVNKNLTTALNICYSGYASVVPWDGPFASGFPGQVVRIAPDNTAFFSDDKAVYDQKFTPTLLNSYVMCDRVMISPLDGLNVFYDFSFKIEAVGDSTKTAIMLVGDKIVNGVSDDS